MSIKLPTLCCTAVLVVSMVQLTAAAPLQNVQPAGGLLKKMTCLRNNDATKKEWKTCIRGTNADHPSYLYPGLDIPVSLSYSRLPAMEIPVK